MDRDSSPRISFGGQTTSMDEAINVIYELSYGKAGDQLTHLNYTHDKLVFTCKWLSESAFKEIQELCWNLPGPTTLQILLTIVVLKTKSLSAGLKCFFIYNTIPWILIAIISILASIFIQNKSHQFSQGLILTFMGCNAAAAGIMVRNFGTFFHHFVWNWPKMILILITAFIFFFYQTPTAITFCMLLSGITSLYIQIEETRRKMSHRSQSLFKNISPNRFLGRNSVILLFVILFFLWIYISIYPDSIYNYAFGFYLVGCLIIGPIQSTFAYFMAIFSTLDPIDSFHIWIGLPLSFLLPGTHTNIGIYFGAMIDGFRGAVLAAICMYLPLFLSLFGLLPQWKFYRDMQGVRRLYEGLTCCTTGLSLGMIALTLQHCMKFDVSSAICIFVISACLNLIVSRYSISIILAGGFLAYMRYISLVCYRYGTYCPFPFNF